MPHVSTRGEGVNRIKGVLYKYARADELKIVCACHGFFLSPAEFVKHGGGGDVAQPLRHIVVNSRPLFQV
ncbi:ninja-family protein afp3 [Phtheirospermum japonicum]|uniref:Ninja-family protein n=1 Tax=Phtheirospermum japonicum TaxID=374723 RepID=A0A830BSE2_9LAMI|nr:ninja-family protein afp3 [Phtheirospermum japonicum]